MDFKDALKLWRKHLDVSQAWVARKMGTTRGYVGKVERGVNHPKEETRKRIISVFGVQSLTEFMAGPPATAGSSFVSLAAPQEVRVPVYPQNQLSPDWKNLGTPIMDLHVHAPGRDLTAVLVQEPAMNPVIPWGGYHHGGSWGCRPIGGEDQPLLGQRQGHDPKIQLWGDGRGGSSASS